MSMNPLDSMGHSSLKALRGGAYVAPELLPFAARTLSKGLADQSANYGTRLQADSLRRVLQGGGVGDDLVYAQRSLDAICNPPLQTYRPTPVSRFGMPDSCSGRGMSLLSGL